MAIASFPYRPAYGVAPGKLLEEYLETQSISARELARRCGRSAKLIVEIISGKASLEPETALQLERVLGMDADVWLRMEATYRLFLARADDATRLSSEIGWAARFPIRELERRGILTASKDAAQTVTQLLGFFGVGR